MMNTDLIFNIRTLVIDDSKITRDMLKHFMRELKFRNVYYATNGKDGLDKLEQAHNEKDPFALVLLDINMPRMNGIELLEKIRTHRWIAKIPVLIISSESEADMIIEAASKGASDYIIKPFELDGLKDKLKKIIGDF